MNKKLILIALMLLLLPSAFAVNYMLDDNMAYTATNLGGGEPAMGTLAYPRWKLQVDGINATKSALSDATHCILWNMTNNIGLANATLDADDTCSFTNVTVGQYNPICYAVMKTTYKTTLNGVDLGSGIGGAGILKNINITRGRCKYSGVGEVWNSANPTLYYMTNALRSRNWTSGAVAPVISAITNRTKATSAVINWTTDIASNTSVNYGTTISLGTWSRTNDAVTSHSKTITTLLANTKYYFNVSSCATSQCSVTGWDAFTTKQLTRNLSITGAVPSNLSQFGTSPIRFTANVTTNMTTINCSWKNNGAVITSQLKSSPLRNVSFLIPFSTTSTNLWTIYCNGEGYQANTTTRTMYYDAVPPTIASPFDNGTAYLVSNITTYFNFTDDFSLYSYNISIDSKQLSRKVNLNSTFYKLNFTHNTTYLSSGIHKLHAILFDGHTALIIAPMDVSTGIFGNKLVYTSNKRDITIQQKSASLFDRFETTKLTDRYTWTFKPSDTKLSSYTFTITSNDPIYIKEKPDSYLKMWLITKNKWIDFDLKNEAETISMKRISSNEVEVTIGNIQSPASQVYNSVGELNRADRDWYFYTTGTPTIQYQSVITETTEISTNLTITRNNSVTTSARFFYNKTEVTPTKTSTASQDIYRINYITPLTPDRIVNMPLYWNLTVGTETNRTKLTQKTYEMFISNCSTYPTRRAIEFNASPEGSTSLLNVNGSGLFTVWLSDSTKFRQKTIQWSAKNSSSICILPNATLHLSYNLEYSRGGYLTRHAADLNTYINTTLQKIHLYLLPTASGASITISLINQISQPLKGYLIDMFRYDVGSGTYTKVQSELSDVLGYASFFNYATSTKYNYNISNTTGQWVYSSGNMYMKDNPTIFRIPIGASSITTTTLGAWQLRTQLYNKSTKIILKWTTLSGTSGIICLNITRTNTTAYQKIANQCSATPAGNMTYNFSAYTQGRINAQAYVKGSINILNSLSLLLDTITKWYEKLALDGYIIYMLLIVVGAAVSIANIQTLPFSLALIHIACWYWGIIPGSIASVFIIVSALMLFMFRTEAV